MRTATSDRQLPVTFVKIEDLEIAFGETHLLAEGEQCQYQHNAMEAVVEPIYIREYTETMVEITDTRLEDRTTGRSISIDEEMQSIAPRNLFEILVPFVGVPRICIGRILPDSS